MRFFRVPYSEAEKNFSSVLDMAKNMGKVLIKRDDGTIFSIKPESLLKSPFDIEGIQTNITTDEVLSFIWECRTR
jgi:hypothetical protein